MYSQFPYAYILDLNGVMDCSCFGVLKIFFIFEETYVVACQEILIHIQCFEIGTVHLSTPKQLI
jgi:hypothetical protein